VTPTVMRMQTQPVDGNRLNLVIVVAVASIVALPMLAIATLALRGGAGAWPANLPRLLWTTIQLCGGAAILTLIIGTCLAWLMVMYEFPGRSVLKWVALLPLALPGYIISFVSVEAFTYAGPVQQALRDTFGWTRPADYLFPDIRSVGGAILVMSLALYPYVYLAGLAAFSQQPVNQLHAAQSLGRKPWQVFYQIALPQARPALFIGVLLVVMECVNDIGAATFFGIGTVTTAIYGIWLDQGDLVGAAQLAALLMVFMAGLVLLEMIAKARTLQDAKSGGRFVSHQLAGWRGVAATAAFIVPIALGFVLPVLLLLLHGSRRWDEVFAFANAAASGRSAMLAAVTASVLVALALLLGHRARTSESSFTKPVVWIASLGYALPGTVLAIGVLVPFSQFDQWLNRVGTAVFGAGPGLLLSSGLFALVFAYVARFLVIAIGHIDDGLRKIPTNIDHVARTLGRKQLQVFAGIHLPLLRPAILSAALLVFVDTMKELPATLMLRPLDFDTLATRVFSLASLGQIESAAIPALLIVVTGLVPVWLLARNLNAAAGD
jgi:iron(III) transport system permease protein